MEDLFDRIISTIILVSAVLSIVFALISEIWPFAFLGAFGVFVVAVLLFTLKKIWE